MGGEEGISLDTIYMLYLLCHIINPTKMNYNFGELGNLDNL